jgi:sirohydrochlorin ferrochelatase
VTRPALLAVGHGSRDPRSAAVAADLVALLSGHRPELDVRVAFLELTDPPVPEVLAQLRRDGFESVVAVPLLLTAAYHTGTDLPAVLAACRESGPTVVQAAPLGPHPLLLAAAEARLREVGVATGDPTTAVVLAAAGSSDPAAQATVAALARAWLRRGWWAVQEAYASAAGPTVAEAVADLRRRGAPRVAVSPYVLAPGRLPDRIVAGARTGPAPADALAAPLGACDELATLVLARYDQAHRALPRAAAAR